MITLHTMCMRYCEYSVSAIATAPAGRSAPWTTPDGMSLLHFVLFMLWNLSTKAWAKDWKTSSSSVKTVVWSSVSDCLTFLGILKKMRKVLFIFWSLSIYLDSEFLLWLKISWFTFNPIINIPTAPLGEKNIKTTTCKFNFDTNKTAKATMVVSDMFFLIINFLILWFSSTIWWLQFAIAFEKLSRFSEWFESSCFFPPFCSLLISHLHFLVAILGQNYISRTSPVKTTIITFTPWLEVKPLVVINKLSCVMLCRKDLGLLLLFGFSPGSCLCQSCLFLF